MSTYMPLIKGPASKTKKGISENIRREVAEGGKDVKQAAAIAYSVASKSRKKKK